jgi:hypothetical protein
VHGCAEVDKSAFFPDGLAVMDVVNGVILAFESNLGNHLKYYTN